MSVLADILGTKDLLGIALVAVTVLAVLFMGRRINLNVRGVSATIEAAAANAETAAKEAAAQAAALKTTVGDPNGNGDLVAMVARLLGETAEIRAELADTKRSLDARTLITRFGQTEPEELGPYTQDRMHDILNLLTVVKGMLDVLWIKLADDYDLPPLPSIYEPPTNEEGKKI